MKNKQKAVSIILTVVLFLFAIVNVQAQSTKETVAIADSLFTGKQYTQSLKLYEEVLNKHFYSKSMLLKMAFIQEGLGRLSESLYYLNLYYLASNDKQALSKMEEMAKKHRLIGYQSSQTRFLQSFLREHNFTIILVSVALIVFLFSLMLFQKKYKKNPLPTSIFLLLPVAILFFQINIGNHTNMGIVKGDATYLMSGPSAGSSVVSIIKEGHLIDVIDKKDIWIHVKWMNRDVYLKEDQVLMVEL